MVADQIIVVLYNKDVQGQVLSKDASLVSLKDKINYIGAIEEGERATSSLGSSSVAANKSQYKSQQRDEHPFKPEIGAVLSINSANKGAQAAVAIPISNTSWHSLCIQLGITLNIY